MSYIPGGDADAIHDNVSGEISAVAEKGTPVDADLVLIEDSAASNAKKKLQLANLLDGATAIQVLQEDFTDDEAAWSFTSSSRGVALLSYAADASYYGYAIFSWDTDGIPRCNHYYGNFSFNTVDGYFNIWDDGDHVSIRNRTGRTAYVTMIYCYYS